MSQSPPFRLPRSLAVLFGLSIVLQLVAPFTTHTYGTDGPNQVYWIGSFAKLISQGVFIPRWLPDGFSGLGAPSFYFYPPLAFYLASLVHLVTGITDTQVLYQGTGLIASIASVGTAWILLRSLGSQKYQAAIGSLLYAFAPFRLAELFSRSSLSTHVGFIFVPLLWCGLVGIVRTDRTRYLGAILLTAVSIAALMLSNIPLTLLCAVSVVIAGIVSHKSLNAANILRAGYAVLIALALTSFYWVSILEYRKYCQLDHLARDPDFVLLDIIHIRNVIALYYDVAIYAIMVLLGWQYWRFRNNPEEPNTVERHALRIGLAICVAIVFLQLPYLSLPIWRHVVVFQLIQGTWRFYIEVVLLASVIIGITKPARLWQASKRILWISTLSAIPPIVLIVFNFHLNAHYQAGANDPAEYAPVSAPHNFASFGQIQAEHAHDLKIASTRSLSANEFVKTIDLAATFEKFSVRLETPSEVILRKFYWPAWHAYVQDKEIPTRPDSIGRTTMVLPRGSYTMTMKLERSGKEEASIWLSAFVFGLVVLTALWDYMLAHRLRSALTDLERPQPK